MVETVKTKVLIIEDEVKLVRFVELELLHEGYEVYTANDGRTGIEKFEECKPDIVLLDLMLPQLSGIEVCRRIRKTSFVPVIMITAKGEVMDKVLGLDSGADDYMTKPFAIEELLARMRAALRHKSNAMAENNILTLKKLTIDVAKRNVTYDDTPVELTKREFDLLTFLVKNKNIVINREQILNQVWGYDYIGETNVVDVYIRYLRNKIDERFGEKLIHTIRGVGYFAKED